MGQLKHSLPGALLQGDTAVVTLLNFVRTVFEDGQHCLKDKISMKEG